MEKVQGAKSNGAHVQGEGDPRVCAYEGEWGRRLLERGLEASCLEKIFNVNYLHGELKFKDPLVIPRNTLIENVETGTAGLEIDREDIHNKFRRKKNYLTSNLARITTGI